MTTATFAPTKQLTPEQEARHALAVELSERNTIVREAIAHSKLGIIAAHIREGELGCFACGYVAPEIHFEPVGKLGEQLDYHYCPWCWTELEHRGWVTADGKLH